MAWYGINYRSKKTIVVSIVSMIVIGVITVSAWILVKGLSNKGKGTQKTPRISGWTVTKKELEDDDKDIIFMVELLFKGIGGESSSEKDKYLEFEGIELDTGVWMFHSMNGRLESALGTCTVEYKALRGDHHVRLTVGDKLSQGGIYQGLPVENQFEVKFHDKIEDIDAAKKRAELQARKDKAEIWDLTRMAGDGQTVFIVEMDGAGEYALEFNRRGLDDHYSFRLRLPKGQVFGECDDTGSSSHHDYLEFRINPRNFLEGKRVVSRATYLALCSKRDGIKFEYPIRFLRKN